MKICFVHLGVPYPAGNHSLTSETHRKSATHFLHISCLENDSANLHICFFFFFFSMWDHFMKTVLLKFCMFMSCLQSSMKVHWIILWQNSFKNAVWWKRKKSIILNSLMPDSSPPSFASRPNQLVCQLTNPQPSPLTSPTVAHFLESLTKSWMLSI